MKTKPLNEAMDIGLHRPPEASYQILACVNEGCNPPYGCGDQWEIARHDNGEWSIECRNCNESAAMLSDVLTAAAKESDK